LVNAQTDANDPLRKSPYQAAQICAVPASFEL
jgi:hypothetical protein